MKTIIIDANILLRFLVNEETNLNIEAKKIFDTTSKGNTNIFLDEVVLAEVVWVLLSFYKIPKDKFVPTLTKIISQNWIVNPRKNLLLKTLETYRQENLSYIDCWICTIGKNQNFDIQTFYQKLLKLSKSSKS